jgi:hypothetical protein
MRKRDELANPDSTWNRAAEEEPLFVIRAKDKLSASMVRQWAEAAAMTGAHEPEKIQEARQLAEIMETWRQENTDG